MGDLMRQELKGFLLIGASLGGLTLAVLAVTASEAQAQTSSAGRVFRDCAFVCPEMVVLPPGTFMMGSPEAEEGRSPLEGPRHQVTIGYTFAVGRFEVTFDEWNACVAAGGCDRPRDEGWGRGRRPMIYVSWDDAQGYVRWLSERTGQRYRLLSESEWEYAARAGTTTPYSTGTTIKADDANFDETGHRGTVRVGSFPPNAFGLFDMHGNVNEWVEDCIYTEALGADPTGYFEPPTDGSASTKGACVRRILRGGSWFHPSSFLRSANRFIDIRGLRWRTVGFRVARTL